MMRGRAWCLLFWLMLCPALAFSHSAALCPALPEDYTGVPPLFEPEPVFTIEALEGESYADSLLAHLNSIHPYHYDKRLGDLVHPGQVRQRLCYTRGMVRLVLITWGIM